MSIWTRTASVDFKYIIRCALTDEKFDFIMNDDIKYRMGRGITVKSDKKYERATFCVDFLEYSKFPGYFAEYMWDGRPCPYFDRTTAELILRTMQAKDFDWSYDARNDAFHTITFSTGHWSTDITDMFVGEDVSVAGSMIRAYPIGTYDWQWSLCPDLNQ